MRVYIFYQCECGREFRSLKWLENHQTREGCAVGHSKERIRNEDGNEATIVSSTSIPQNVDTQYCSGSSLLLQPSSVASSNTFEDSFKPKIESVSCISDEKI